MLTPLHLNCKLPTMTSHEILKADVLDILFENRNKQYGAYALRKDYNHRLLLALSVSLTAVFIVCLLVKPGERLDAVAFEPEKDIVKLIDVVHVNPPIEPPAPQPAQAAAPVATQQHSSLIEIVPEVAPEDMVPELEALATAQIGTVTTEGVAPTENRTIEPEPVQQGTGSAPAQQLIGDFTAVERLPEFPGGVSAWSAFLGRHLQAPRELEAGERRTVQVKFWVGEDGSVARFEVVQSAGAVFDNEVIRVLKKMPKWKPAIQNGHPVAVTFTQPVTFQAVEE
jgi:periplasmic protein TonB